MCEWVKFEWCCVIHGCDNNDRRLGVVLFVIYRTMLWRLSINYSQSAAEALVQGKKLCFHVGILHANRSKKAMRHFNEVKNKFISYLGGHRILNMINYCKHTKSSHHPDKIISPDSRLFQSGTSRICKWMNEVIDREISLWLRTKKSKCN